MLLWESGLMSAATLSSLGPSAFLLKDAVE
jgi:hypothetical protein